MEPTEPRPGAWNPDRAWADPLILLLVLLVGWLSWQVLQRRRAAAPAFRAGVQGRLLELPHAAQAVFGAPLPSLAQPRDPARAAGSLAEPWDRAVAAVLAADAGDLQPGRVLAAGPGLEGPAAAAFWRCWRRAYEAGPAVDPTARAGALEALGRGWAATLLDQRLRRADGEDPGPALAEAQAALRRKLWLLGALGTLAGLALLAGLGVGLVLPFLRKPAPAPAFAGPPCAGRGLALVLLGWLLGLLLSGTVAGGLVALAPFLRPYALTLSVALHVGWGLLLLRAALGVHWHGFLGSLWGGGLRRGLGWGLGFLALALPLVLAAGWLAQPLTRHAPAPQREVLEFLAGLRGGLPVLLAGLTVAGLAPLFEELIFRGTLLPAVARRWGWPAGILASGLLFGAVHLQPGGLPTLCTLGLVLGIAFRRGGGLLAPVLVHALWNGGVFLFMRSLAG